MDSAAPFTALTAGHDPDEPLIPDTADPYTVTDHRNVIATALGFPDRRYSGTFPRKVMERLYMVVFGDLPSDDCTLDELKYEVAVEVGFADTDRFVDGHGRAFDRSQLVGLVDVLSEYTYGDLADRLAHLDICTVCGQPVENTIRVGTAGQVASTEEELCLHTTDDGDIVVVEHWGET